MPHAQQFVSGIQRVMPMPFDLLQEAPSLDECEPSRDLINFENTHLYMLIGLRTRSGMKKAYDHILTMRPFEFKKRSTIDQSTFLHHLLNQAPIMHKKYATTMDLVPIIYQLALKGVVVNAQNKHGNTCLHLACLRPNAGHLSEHLLRIGIDPCIPNNHGCRIVHTINNNVFRMVKGESDVRSGLWYAVQHENLELSERLMKCWCRVDVARNKTFLELAEETANDKLVSLLLKHRLTNEMVCAAYACDIPLIHSLAKQGPIDFKVRNESFFLSRPLVVCLEVLGYWSQGVIKVLLEYGATTFEEFNEEEREHIEKFEKSDLYKLVEENTIESLGRAADLILENKVDLRLVSYKKERMKWTYLHYIVDRCIYRLALAGINVNARTEEGNTALHVGALDNNQMIINHLLRIGCDSMITNAKGECVAVEMYYGKGQIVLTKKCRSKNLPGLQAAVKLNSLESTERWLATRGRVNCKRGDRFLLDIAKSLKQTEIVNLLKEYYHINEFFCATLACDYQRVMNIIALGDGLRKINAVDEYYPTGMVVNYRCEYIHRPIVVAAMVLTTPQILDFLLRFKADLTPQYEERPPCGPLAFWAFHQHICNTNTRVVVEYAEVTLRDEMGCTMLHRIIAKDVIEGKLDIVKILLQRNINIAARDLNGSTARDYTFIYSAMEMSSEICQILDDHLLDLVKLDNLIEVEQLVLSGYDHILDIRDSSKNRTALEIAESKQYYNMQMFLKKMDQYFKEIHMLQMAVISGDMRAVAKHAMEKKCAQCITRGGQTLLHLAVLFEKYEVLVYLLDYFPNLINRTDNIGRTALHYCVCLEDRLTFWPPLQDAGAEPAMADASNLTVYDYVKQLKNPVPTHMKSRARQWRDYKPTVDFVEEERKLVLERLRGETSIEVTLPKEEEKMEKREDPVSKFENSLYSHKATELNSKSSPQASVNETQKDLSSSSDDDDI